MSGRGGSTRRQLISMVLVSAGLCATMSRCRLRSSPADRRLLLRGDVSIPARDSQRWAVVIDTGLDQARLTRVLALLGDSDAPLRVEADLVAALSAPLASCRRMAISDPATVQQMRTIARMCRSTQCVEVSSRTATTCPPLTSQPLCVCVIVQWPIAKLLPDSLQAWENVGMSPKQSRSDWGRRSASTCPRVPPADVLWRHGDRVVLGTSSRSASLTMTVRRFSVTRATGGTFSKTGRP